MLNTLKYIMIGAAIYALAYYVVKGVCARLETYKFTAGDTPKVLIVGGTHGNEQAGSEAMIELVRQLKAGELKLKKGTLTVLPTANPCGKELGIRFQPHQMMIFQSIDLNRAYPKTPEEEGSCVVSRQIADLVLKNDFVIDLHEGYTFNHIDGNSMGSCVFPGNSKLAEKIAKQAVDELNQTIVEKPRGGTRQDLLDMMSLSDFKWQSRTDWPELAGTLRWHADNHKIDYILIETTGQDNIQPMPVRVRQHLILVKSFLRQLGML